MVSYKGSYQVVIGRVTYVKGRTLSVLGKWHRGVVRDDTRKFHLREILEVNGYPYHWVEPKKQTEPKPKPTPKPKKSSEYNSSPLYDEDAAI